MNSGQVNFLKMLISFNIFKLKFVSITDKLPKFKENSDILTEIEPQLQEKSKLQMINKKGTTVGKQEARKSLAVLVVDYSRKLSAFALFTNNTALASKVKFTESALNKLPDTEIKNSAQIVYDAAQEFLSELSAYGISDETQSTLLTSINEFSAFIGIPLNEKSEQTLITQDIVQLIDMAKKAFKITDASVEIVRTEEANFYLGYKQIRSVENRGKGSLAARVNVTDGDTGEPLSGATIVITLIEGKYPLKGGKLVKKSAEKGGCNIKTLDEGTYQFVITKPGYKEVIQTENIISGELTVLNIKLYKK